MPTGRTDLEARRPVLYQICRAGDRFEVGDGPFDLTRLKVLILGRGAEGGYDARANEDTVRVADPWMSARHAALQRDGSAYIVSDEGSTNGVLINGKRTDRALLESGDLIETGRTFWVYLNLPADPALPIEPVSFGHMASWNPTFCMTLDKLSRASRSGTAIVLGGEPGVGKAYCAREVHAVSGRAGRFVTLDASTTTPEKQMPELFGAQDVRAGAVVLSSGGTLFVHRVERLHQEAQEALADVMATGRASSLAGGRAVNVELHVCASTEIDLRQAMQRGRFSRVLFTQLSQTSVTLPPLRDRREDLGLLIESLLIRAGGAPALTRDACRALLNYPWPRNVRELSKVIEGGSILAGDEGIVDLRHLPGVVAGRSGVEQGASALITTEQDLRPVENESTLPGDDDDDDPAESFLEEGPTDPDQLAPEHLRGRPAKDKEAKPHTRSAMPAVRTRPARGR